MAHQTRLYAGHQPSYSQPRMELGASAHRIHHLQQQYPRLINHIPEMVGTVSITSI